VYEPLDRVTVPVGGVVSPGVELDTVTVTFRLWLDDTVFAAGVTVTVAAEVPKLAGHAFTTLATFNDPRPEAWSYPVVALYPDWIPTVSPE